MYFKQNQQRYADCYFCWQILFTRFSVLDPALSGSLQKKDCHIDDNPNADRVIVQTACYIAFNKTDQGPCDPTPRTGYMKQSIKQTWANPTQLQHHTSNATDQHVFHELIPIIVAMTGIDQMITAAIASFVRVFVIGFCSLS